MVKLPILSRLELLVGKVIFSTTATGAMLGISATQLLLAIFIVFITYYLIVIWKPRYFTQLGVKGPFPWPLVGVLPTVIAKGSIGSNTYLSQKYGRVYGVFGGTKPMLLVSDPDFLQQVLIKNFNVFTDRMNVTSGDPIADSFLTAVAGDQWRRIRHIMTPTFSAGKLKQMLPEMNECAKIFSNNLSKLTGTVVNMKDRAGDFTMDVIARTAFGIEVDTQSNPNSPFVIYAKKLFQTSILRPTMIIFLLRSIGFSLFPKDSMAFFRDVVTRAYAVRKADNASKVDFLQLMITACSDHDAASDVPVSPLPEDSTKRGLSEDEVIAQSMIFLLAGYDTTATTLSLVTYNLALNLDCQEKLYQEIVKMTGEKTDNQVDYDVANSLPYLDQCIQETLRLYPPAIRTDRQALVDITINGVRIPKGQYVGIQIYNLHHDPDLWPDPEKFNPERFTSEAIASHHPCQYMPFSQGPRMCIGMRLAQLELKVALVYLVKRFRFHVCAETEVPLTFKATALLEPKHGIQLKVELRS